MLSWPKVRFEKGKREEIGVTQIWKRGMCTETSTGEVQMKASIPPDLSKVYKEKLAVSSQARIQRSI